MKPLATLVCLIALGLPGTAGAHVASSCEEAVRVNGWCESANTGYMAGLPVRSRFLYEVLDAHGHDIVPEDVKCETCRKALQGDGYCPIHKMGFVHGEAFLSPLTYHLARARTIDPATLTCPICRKHTHGIGWCDKDRVGIAGPFAIDDRREFDELVKAYTILLTAVDMSRKCETCAGAMITDGYCAVHHVKYDGGRPVSGTPP
jgi:hypothetical protein